MTSLTQIKDFFSEKAIAVAGASRSPQKFGGMVLSELKKRGFDLYPINPNTSEIAGTRCYSSVMELPEVVSNLLIVTPKNQTSSIVTQAVDKGIKKIWIQQKSETKEAIEFAEKNNIQVIHGKCVFMFAEPVAGVHKFHRFCAKLFGGFPKG